MVLTTQLGREIDPNDYFDSNGDVISPAGKYDINIWSDLGISPTVEGMQALVSRYGVPNAEQQEVWCFIEEILAEEGRITPEVLEMIVEGGVVLPKVHVERTLGYYELERGVLRNVEEAVEQLRAAIRCTLVLNSDLVIADGDRAVLSENMGKHMLLKVPVRGSKMCGDKIEHPDCGSHSGYEEDFRIDVIPSDPDAMKEILGIDRGIPE